jgi:hypothetical protein
VLEVALAPGRPAQVFWQGRSGRSYRHEVFSLIACPPVVRATYLLATRDMNGQLRALDIGTASALAPTLNLAHIRRRGAQLGATEVHIHATPHVRGSLALRRIARDLRAA